MKIVTKSAATLCLLKQHMRRSKSAHGAANRMQRALEVLQHIVHVLYHNAHPARCNTRST